MREDIELLQGTWSVKSLEIDEREMPTSMLANASILVEGNRFISLGMGAEYEGTLELGPSTTPAELNMKFDGGPEKGNVNRGIYELDEIPGRFVLPQPDRCARRSFRRAPPAAGS
jgi:uncharacterized protein (TIGR03067 family)